MGFPRVLQLGETGKIFATLHNNCNNIGKAHRGRNHYGKGKELGMHGTDAWFTPCVLAT